MAGPGTVTGHDRQFEPLEMWSRRRNSGEMAQHELRCDTAWARPRVFACGLVLGEIFNLQMCTWAALEPRTGTG
jgi:hypothetical protein